MQTSESNFLRDISLEEILKNEFLPAPCNKTPKEFPYEKTQFWN